MPKIPGLSLLLLPRFIFPWAVTETVGGEMKNSNGLILSPRAQARGEKDKMCVRHRTAFSHPRRDLNPPLPSLSLTHISSVKKTFFCVLISHSFWRRINLCGKRDLRCSCGPPPLPLPSTRGSLCGWASFQALHTQDGSQFIRHSLSNAVCLGLSVSLDLHIF